MEDHTRKGRAKPNVAGERYDSNARPILSDYVEKFPTKEMQPKSSGSGMKKKKYVEPRDVSRNLSNASRKKVFKKKKPKSSIPESFDDMTLQFIAVPFLFFVFGSLLLKFMKEMIKALYKSSSKYTTNTVLKLAQPVLQMIEPIVRSLFGPALTYQFNAVVFLTAVFVLISIQTTLKRSNVLQEQELAILKMQ